MNRTTRKTLLVTSVASLALLGAACEGRSSAAAPGETIDACVATATGTVRFIEPGTECEPGETAMAIVQGGTKGDKGDRGETGAAGADGENGADGESSGIGATGPQGIPGLPGAQGPEGDQGPQGLQGLPGDQGVQGVQGVQGEQGPQGDQGDQGDQGETGAVGPAGPGAIVSSASEITLESAVPQDLAELWLPGSSELWQLTAVVNAPGGGGANVTCSIQSNGLTYGKPEAIAPMSVFGTTTVVVDLSSSDSEVFVTCEATSGPTDVDVALVATPLGVPVP